LHLVSEYLHKPAANSVNISCYSTLIVTQQRTMHNQCEWGFKDYIKKVKPQTLVEFIIRYKLPLNNNTQYTRFI